MGLLDELGGLVKQAASGNAPEADVHAAYDRVAGSVPQGQLADGIKHAFESDRTPPFPQMVSGLFSRSNPDQKAGILNQILGSVGGPGALSGLLGAGGLGSLGGILSRGQATPQEAQQVPAQDVQVLAQHAQASNPSVVDAVSGFAAQHPDLVKALGAGAIALLLARVTGERR